jgi:pimeloyl-ACP methyl ester carboxylesterase
VTSAGPSDIQPFLPPGVERKLVRIGQLDTCYLAYGRDALGTIVFLHGSNLSGATWLSTITTLGEDYWCIAPDLRGHGDTQWPATPDYGLDHFSADVRGLIAHLGARRPVLAGMSLGGLVALNMVLDGFEARALVMIDSGPRMVRRTAAQVPEFLRRHRYPSLDAAVGAALAFNPRRSKEWLERSLTQTMVRGEHGEWSWKWDPRRLEGMPRSSDASEGLWTRLGEVQCPALIVRGAESDVFPAAYATDLSAAIRQGSLATVDGAGHNVQGDNPRALAAVIRSFLRETLPLGCGGARGVKRGELGQLPLRSRLRRDFLVLALVASQAVRRSSCATARRIQAESERSSASAARRACSSRSGGNRTGTGALSWVPSRRDAGTCGSWFSGCA